MRSESGRCSCVIGMTSAGESSDVLAGVIEIEQRFGSRKRFSCEVFQAVTGIADGELLFSCIPTDLRRLPPQFQSELIEFIQTR